MQARRQTARLVDTTASGQLTAYAEQLWDTMFAKARQMLLFEWSAMTAHPTGRPRRLAGFTHEFGLQPVVAGLDEQRPGRIARTHHRPRVSPASLGTVEPVPRPARQPHRHAGYKPYQSTGEDFPAQLSRDDWHSHGPVSGIPDQRGPGPVDRVGESPDPDIVAKIKGQLDAGKSVVITSGLLHALSTGASKTSSRYVTPIHKVLAHEYSAASARCLTAGKTKTSCSPKILLTERRLAGCPPPRQRFDTAAEAIEKATAGSGVLILADEYPDKTTVIDDALFESAAKKNCGFMLNIRVSAKMEVGKRRKWPMGVEYNVGCIR